MNELYGLIACGGRSSRMGRDKSLMVYHKQPQRYHLAELLSPFCSQVFLSCNAEQGTDPNLPTIIDEYEGIGPMSGLLAAFHRHPYKSFLYLGCDYPLIRAEDIQKLKEARDETYQAVCYFSETEEPLLAVYEASAREVLLQFFQSGNYSLNQFLKTIFCKHIQAEPRLRSVDSWEDYEEMRRNGEW